MSECQLFWYLGAFVLPMMSSNGIVQDQMLTFITIDQNHLLSVTSLQPIHHFHFIVNTAFLEIRPKFPEVHKCKS